MRVRERPACVTFKQIRQNKSRKAERNEVSLRGIKKKNDSDDTPNLFFTVAVQMDTGDLAAYINEGK